MRTAYTLIIFTAAVILGCSSDDHAPALKTEAYVGEWVVYEMAKDNIVREVWEGRQLNIEQTSDHGGEYSMPNAPYDSLWITSGFWQSKDESMFILNDTIYMTYARQADTLLLETLVPDICVPEEGVCILGITGFYEIKLVLND